FCSIRSSSAPCLPSCPGSNEVLPIFSAIWNSSSPLGRERWSGRREYAERGFGFHDRDDNLAVQRIAVGQAAEGPATTAAATAWGNEWKNCSGVSEMHPRCPSAMRNASGLLPQLFQISLVEVGVGNRTA